MHGVLFLVGFLLAFQTQPHTGQGPTTGFGDGFAAFFAKSTALAPGQALARRTSSAMESWIWSCTALSPAQPTAMVHLPNMFRSDPAALPSCGNGDRL